MENRSVLITGAASGIGFNAAQNLRDAGWRVFAACRNPQDCAQLRAMGFMAPHIDYSDATSIENGLAEVLEATGGRLDALFNNGAFAIPGAVEDLPTDALRANFEANLFGWHDLTTRVIPVMRAQGPRGQGRIVNCSSILGLVAAPWRGSYNATKFALEGLTDTLRLEMRDTDIHIVTLGPGPITSAFRKNAARQFERWIDWEASPRAAQYRETLVARLYRDGGPDPFELPPDAVSRKLRHALEHPRPKRRYHVTTPAYLLDAARRVLPTRALDWLLAKA